MVDFSFVGHDCDVVLLFWRCVLHFNVICFIEFSNVFDIVSLSIAVKNIVSFLLLGNSNFLTNLT